MAAVPAASRKFNQCLKQRKARQCLRRGAASSAVACSSVLRTITGRCATACTPFSSHQKYRRGRRNLRGRYSTVLTRVAHIASDAPGAGICGQAERRDKSSGAGAGREEGMRKNHHLPPESPNRRSYCWLFFPIHGGSQARGHRDCTSAPPQRTSCVRGAMTKIFSRRE